MAGSIGRMPASGIIKMQTSDASSMTNAISAYLERRYAFHVHFIAILLMSCSSYYTDWIISFQ